MLTVLCMEAQPVTATSYETMIEVAEESAEKKDYANAIEWFEKAYEESKDKDLKVAVGDLYMRLRDYKKAARAYDRVLSRDKDGIYEYLRIDYARALKYQGQYREALNEFRVVASTAANDTVKNDALFELKGIEAMDTYSQNLEAVIEFGGTEINSGSGENSPSRYKDGTLYFSSFNRKTVIVPEEEEDGYEAKIFTSAQADDGTYEKPKALNKKINREGYNNAGVAFSGDGRIMYFTRAKLDVNVLEESTIFMSFSNDDGWGSPNEVPSINGDYLAMHPNEGELFGNRVLFFVSDMDGGYGGYDLYYSTITGDSYSSPVNLGPSINTEKDDITPFYQNGTLYFSTDGRPGFGGQDIWYATWNGSEFEEITNMGYNYNSPQDDMYLRFSPQATSGFLVSNRPDKDKQKLKGSETCCDDIYKVQLREIVIDLAITVEGPDGPLKEATVEVIDLSIDDDNALQSKTNVVSNDFSFLLEADHKYRVVVTRDGYYPDTTVSFNTVGLLDSYTVKKKVVLQPMPVVPTDGEEMEIVEANEPIRLNKIYFDLDEAEILPDAEEDLAYLKSLMDQYPDMVIELSSHTDAQGGDDYNRRLSQRRATSTKNWLVDKGVATARIKAVGYGETQITNHCVEGVRCSDTEHRVNRRSEFKIIAGPQTIQIKKQITRTKTSGSKESGMQSYEPPLPVFSFVEDSIYIGTLAKGDTKDVEFHFTNVGDADLIIEVVTACKCTNLEWPTEAIKPGEMGVIRATYDTSSQDLGMTVKTVDIISNTKSLVTEVKFASNLVEKVTKTK